MIRANFSLSDQTIELLRNPEAGGDLSILAFDFIVIDLKVLILKTIYDGVHA
jgi:hypothetical protein